VLGQESVEALQSRFFLAGVVGPPALEGGVAVLEQADTDLVDLAGRVPFEVQGDAVLEVRQGSGAGRRTGGPGRKPGSWPANVSSGRWFTLFCLRALNAGHHRGGVDGGQLVVVWQPTDERVSM